MIKMMMVKYLLYKHLWIIVTLASVGISGCGAQDKSEEWGKRSPFRDVAEGSAKEIVLVRCRSYPLHLSGQVDLRETGFWREYGLWQAGDSGRQEAAGPSERGKEGPAWPGALPTTFAADMVSLWQSNGLIVAVAPLEAWGPFREELLALGAQMPNQEIWVVGKAPEQRNLYTYPLNEASHLFFARKGGVLDGQTFEAGQLLFRMRCEPEPGGGAGSAVYMKLVPVFQSGRLQQSFGPDDYGTIQRISVLPEVAFDFLALEGVVPAEHFVFIASRSPAGPTRELGQTMFTSMEEGNNEQLALVVLCQVRTGKQLKAEAQ